MEMAKKDGSGYVKITELAKALKSDPRTVINHLKITEMYGVGIFIPSDKPIFFKIKKLEI